MYTPQDWYDLIRSARRKNAFAVSEMESHDFVSVSKIKESITNRKVTIHG